MHSQFCSFEIKGFKEGKTHEMVPMGMGEKKVNGIGFFIGEFISKTPDAGAGIDNNNIIAVGSDF
jgi:hypothetical protein